MTSELWQQIRVLDPVTGWDGPQDVWLVEGKIQAVAPSLTPDEQTQVRSGSGLILAPGLVDLYSHSGEPGHEDRETLDSLVAAAQAGGFTRITLLPNTQPALDQPGNLSYFHRVMQSGKLPKVALWGALTLGTAGEQMTELAELAAAGIVGFSDGAVIANRGLLRRILEYLRPLGIPVALMAGDRTLAGNGVMREGDDSIQLGLPGIPAMAETAALAALLEMIAELETPVHLMRISTARGVELIRQAKSRGLPITASTPWLHLLQNTSAIASYDPNLRLDPPLGTPSDQAALIAGVKDGTIDAIAVDHAPYSYEEKTVAFGEAPPGSIGYELALPLLWQGLVETGKLTALELWQAISTRPAHCLQQSPPTVAPESVEAIVFHPQTPWIANRQSLKSLSLNTPWLGQEIIGRVIP